MHSHWTWKICKVGPEVCNADVAPNLTQRVAARSSVSFLQIRTEQRTRDSQCISGASLTQVTQIYRCRAQLPSCAKVWSQLRPLDLRLLDLHLNRNTRDSSIRAVSKKNARICQTVMAVHEGSVSASTIDHVSLVGPPRYC